MAPDRAGDFGTKLREARERKGVSLRQIANKTKISMTALEALERNDISRLPGGIFSRAFVRSYALEVGLDPETTIQEFIAQFPHDSVVAGHPDSDQVEDFEALESDRRLATNVLLILAISLPLAGAVVYFTMTSRRAAQTAPASVASAPVQAAPTETKSEPSPAPTAGAAPAPTGVAGSGAPEAPAPAPSESAGRGGASSARPPSSPASPVIAQSVAGSQGDPEAKSDQLTIGLTARRPVWISATVDGQRAISRLLQAGEKQTVDVKREMVITAGDAAALGITLNGADARPLGKTAEVVTVRINLTNFKDYLAR